MRLQRLSFDLLSLELLSMVVSIGVEVLGLTTMEDTVSHWVS